MPHILNTEVLYVNIQILNMIVSGVPTVHEQLSF